MLYLPVRSCHGAPGDTVGALELVDDFSARALRAAEGSTLYTEAIYVITTPLKCGVTAVGCVL